jgi:putative ABC transport system permease protein
MIGIESIQYSLRNLWQRKTRSFFTILSIFVGITTIFIFISFGWGLYDYVGTLSSGSSADKIMIQAKGSGAPGMDDTFKLTDDDVKVIEKTIGIFDASGVYSKPALVQQERIKKYTFLVSYDPAKPLILEVNNVGMDKGRKLQKNDMDRVVLGYNYQLPNKIFPKPYKVGDKINVQGQKLRIIGFLQAIGSPQDDSQIYVINDMIDGLYPEKKNSYAMIIAKADIRDMKGVIERVTKNLRKERGLKEGNEDFFVVSFEDQLKAFLMALNIVVGFIVLIALISVVVSVVNTANTMITSVLERVKEIGVIKSIGARNSEIFKIFLFESGFLGFVAGAIGVFVGWIFASITASILKGLGWGFLNPHYSWSLFLGAILFATITGAISGVIPAYQASKLRPVDALRYE